MDDLFAMCQRVDRMTKAEDWSLPVLASHLHTLLWKWLAWEPAQHCIANKLRTTLGKPQDTFTNIEGDFQNNRTFLFSYCQDMIIALLLFKTNAVIILSFTFHCHSTQATKKKVL